LGGDHHRRYIVGFHLLEDLFRQSHTHPFDNVDDSLFSEDGFFNVVTGAIETDDQTIAHQLIIADALDVGEVFDAGGIDRCCHAKQYCQQNETGEAELRFHG